VVSVADVLTGKSVCICAGAGGVGKTTTAAAIALGMAVDGARVAVVTIDPARRLAQSLGMEALENEPRRVDPDRLRSAGLEARGELWAMMLDPKRTFDELIDAVAGDPEAAEAIKANRVYRELSGAVSGSQEFTAVSKLYELSEEHDFDLIVLDTPPSRNAVDFLEAPRRLTSFLDGRALRTILRPTGHGVRLLGQGAGALLGALSKVTGVDLWADLTGFFGLLGGMTADFSARAARVERMLQADTTAFMLVTSAQAEAIDEAIWFRNTLRSRGLPFSGVVVNRFHHDLSADVGKQELERHLADLLDNDLRARVLANQADYGILARRDASNLARLERELAGEQVLLVPQFDDNVHDVEGLLLVQRYLFASDAQRRALIDELVA
jgi:anion-transporting  ArsA/GET3 family ATPase